MNESLIEQGYLMKKISEDGKLYLLNYTNKCTYEKKWNKHTLNNRGHVYEVGTNKLIAYAFPKFFNLGELETEKQKLILQKTNYTITEKLDGSLGIIYYYDGEWRCNTRGSFNSDQAIEAMKIIEEKYDLSEMSTRSTLLVEIIYPSNKIIMDYGDKRELILLSCYWYDVEVDREALETISLKSGIPLVKQYTLTFDEMFEFQESKNFDIEGFVVRFENGYRVKIKSKEYLKVARLMANMSPKNIWENMVEGKVKVESLELLPEEFRKDVDKIVSELELKYALLKEDIHYSYEELMIDEPTRKEIGLNKELQHKGAIFCLLDDKIDKLDNYIWKHIKPEIE